MAYTFSLQVVLIHTFDEENRSSTPWIRWRWGSRGCYFMHRRSWQILRSREGDTALGGNGAISAISEGAPATNMMLSKVGAAIPQAPAGSVLCNVANCGVNLPITAATCGRLWQKHALNQRLNYNHPTRSTVLCKGYRNPNARRPAPIYPASAPVNPQLSQ